MNWREGIISIWFLFFHSARELSAFRMVFLISFQSINVPAEQILVLMNDTKVMMKQNASRMQQRGEIKKKGRTVKLKHPLWAWRRLLRKQAYCKENDSKRPREGVGESSSGYWFWNNKLCFSLLSGYYSKQLEHIFFYPLMLTLHTNVFRKGDPILQSRRVESLLEKSPS